MNNFQIQMNPFGFEGEEDPKKKKKGSLEAPVMGEEIAAPAEEEQPKDEGGFRSAIKKYFDPVYDSAAGFFAPKATGVSQGLLAGAMNQQGSGLEYGLNEDMATQSEGSVGGITASSAIPEDLGEGKDNTAQSTAAFEAIMQALKSVQPPKQGPVGAGRVGGGGFRAPNRKNLRKELLDREYESLYMAPTYRKLTK